MSGGVSTTAWDFVGLYAYGPLPAPKVDCFLLAQSNSLSMKF